MNCMKPLDWKKVRTMPNTREKLIELMKDGWSLARHYRYAKEEALADHLIANGVTIQDDHHWATEQAYKNGYADGQPKWISVKDRLPDTAERVLVCKTWLGRVHKPEYGYYQDFPNSKGCWYVLTEYGYYPQREVTHWMPLPEAPKGEE